jgi:hypothetical protein
VSVEPAHEQQQHSDPTFNFMVDSSVPTNHEHDLANYLQDFSYGDLGTVAFSDGAYDASFNPPLDFSFDDFIHDDTASTVPVDSGVGAA